MAVNECGYWIQVDAAVAHSGRPIRGAVWMHRAPHKYMTYPYVHIMVWDGERLTESPNAGRHDCFADDVATFAYILESDREWRP
jgi:hypothetical protein